MGKGRTGEGATGMEMEDIGGLSVSLSETGGAACDIREVKAPSGVAGNVRVQFEKRKPYEYLRI